MDETVGVTTAKKTDPPPTDAVDENRWFGHLYMVSNVVLTALFLVVDGASHTRKASAVGLSVAATLVFLIHTKPTMDRAKGKAFGVAALRSLLAQASLSFTHCSSSDFLPCTHFALLPFPRDLKREP
jgi:hypothetical protein